MICNLVDKAVKLSKDNRDKIVKNPSTKFLHPYIYTSILLIKIKYQINNLRAKNASHQNDF